MGCALRKLGRERRAMLGGVVDQRGKRRGSAGLFPIFLFLALVFYFMPFSFELKFEHKFADYMNAQPE
jgi:hypothetical protein